MRHLIDISSFTVASSQKVVRLLSLTAVLVIGLEAAPVQAQEWIHYQAYEDRFSVDFPSEPTIEETTYVTEYGFTLPARIYTAEDRFGTYTVTAVDWSGAQAMHDEAFDACILAAGDHGGDNPEHCSRLYSPREVRGAALHATFGFLKRGSQVTHLGIANNERVEGIGVQLHNEDNSQSHALIFWHNYHLLIAEGVAPQGMPPTLLFSTSLGFLDEEGNRITYGDRYSPLEPVPHRTR